ncbi:MAG: hypothetical protein AAB567_01630 [Patescibacteria group bacterium]
MNQGRIKVLVIVDDAEKREWIVCCLEKAGYYPTIGATSEEGIKKFRQDGPQVIIMNYDPEQPLIRAFTAEINKDVTILVLGPDDEKMEFEAFDQGADTYLKKDATPKEVVARLKILLRSSPRRRVKVE